LGDIAVKCRLAGALKGKIITVFHGYDLTSYPRKTGKHVYDLLFKHCELCLPISVHWKNKLIEMGCDEKKIQVHRMGVDFRQFNKLPKIEKKKDSIKILSIGRLVEKKGIEYGIKAISMVRDSYPNIEYTIAGDGPLREKLNKLIRSLDLDRNVTILGWVNQEDVTKLMLHSDILITPSITANDGDQEGIPVVIMEAQAMGLPVISTYHSGIPELIIDGHNGYLVKERDSSAHADKINLLISSESKIKSFKLNGKKSIEEHFDIGALNSDLEKIFNQTIQRK
jgi:colanic acid/amylovoran biosynthesis glycosyltransferase